jgi:hypothetical protein
MNNYKLIGQRYFRLFIHNYEDDDIYKYPHGMYYLQT